MRFTNLTNNAALTICMLFTLGGLTACGNKGALYIPEPPVEQQSAPQEQQDPEKS
jgi:predicted small lipoprotein YifL